LLKKGSGELAMGLNTSCFTTSPMLLLHIAAQALRQCLHGAFLAPLR
jgi:hypothetical protein